MMLYKIFGAISIFLLSASLLSIVLSLVIATVRDREEVFYSTLVISGIVIAIALCIGLIALALWVLGV